MSIEGANLGKPLTHEIDVCNPADPRNKKLATDVKEVMGEKITIKDCAQANTSLQALENGARIKITGKAEPNGSYKEVVYSFNKDTGTVAVEKHSYSPDPRGDVQLTTSENLEDRPFQKGDTMLLKAVILNFDADRKNGMIKG